MLWWFILFCYHGLCNPKCLCISFIFGLYAVYLQVGTFSLVDIERDFLSIDKRYPKLFASPEFSKVLISSFVSALNFLLLSFCLTLISFLF